MDALRARLTGAVLVGTGLMHLLAPRRLLDAAGRGLESVLAIQFRPPDGTPRRVRAVGLAMVLAGAHLLYHGGVVPR